MDIKLVSKSALANVNCFLVFIFARLIFTQKHINQLQKFTIDMKVEGKSQISAKY